MPSVLSALSVLSVPSVPSVPSASLYTSRVFEFNEIDLFIKSNL